MRTLNIRAWIFTYMTMFGFQVLIYGLRLSVVAKNRLYMGLIWFRCRINQQTEFCIFGFDSRQFHQGWVGQYTLEELP